MLHWVYRLDGFGVPSPFNPRDPTTFIKKLSPEEADQDDDSTVKHVKNKNQEESDEVN